MRHYFHGLFGSPSDWADLIPETRDVILHDLYHEEDLLELRTTSQDILVGYSMGGRIALEIAQRNQFNLRQLVLLSTHPGIGELERPDRVLWENVIQEKMRTLTPDEFLNFWNSLSLFSSSRIEKQTVDRLRQSDQLFKRFRLSRFKTDWNLLREHRKKITWVIGSQDLKYVGLTQERISPLEIEVLTIPTDHRVLMAKEHLKRAFKEREIL